jgi:2,3-bisphosphoglycerate-independent phosphoglycerate mutase
MERKPPVVLAIVDGFGYNSEAAASPWTLAKHPNFSEIEKWYPFTTLQASSLAVGLPWGEAGNSEVGHLTIGAGKIIYSHLPRIITSIQDGSFAENPVFIKAVERGKAGGNVHIMGLFSSGSVHSYAEHLYALLDLMKEKEVPRVYLHLFSDGRDAPPKESAGFFRNFEMRLEKFYPNAKIVSVIGRNFSMDRDRNWSKIEKTYRLLTESGFGEKFEIASEHIEKCYAKDLTDEFVEPGFAATGLNGDMNTRIKPGDAAIYFNYREDSERELTASFVLEEFSGFQRKKVANLVFVTMTQYDPEYPAEVAFPPLVIENPLAKIISEAGLKQLHIAETEKYAHVTYFFNGGREKPFDGEDRALVPSPHVHHYDEVPEMSACAVTEKVIESLGSYDFILVNFANTDMVGHTGNFEACVKSIEVIDDCVGKIAEKIIGLGGTFLITSDHGNVEEKMYRVTGGKRTNHTTNPVPFFIVGQNWKRKAELNADGILKSYGNPQGVITDVAPTVLEILGLKPAPEMTGRSLLPRLK